MHPAIAAFGARGPESLEQRLAALHACAREAAPGLEDAFAQRLAEVAPMGLASEALAKVRMAELAEVVRAAVSGDEAVVRLERRLRPIVQASVRSISGLEDAATVVDQIVERLLTARDGSPMPLASYAGLGPLDAFVRIAATREALTRRRLEAGRPGKAEFDESTHALETLASEGLFLRAEHRAAFSAAFGEAIARLAPRDRNLLRFHFLERTSLDALAKSHGVHRATVARWIAEARERVLDATRASIEAQLRLEPEEVDSFLRAISDSFEVSVSRLFAEGA